MIWHGDITAEIKEIFEEASRCHLSWCGDLQPAHVLYQQRILKRREIHARRRARINADAAKRNALLARKAETERNRYLAVNPDRHCAGCGSVMPRKRGRPKCAVCGLAKSRETR